MAVSLDLDRVEVRLLHPDATPPQRTRPGDAGYDLRAVSAFALAPGERATVVLADAAPTNRLADAGEPQAAGAASGLKCGFVCSAAVRSVRAAPRSPRAFSTTPRW